MGRNWSFSSSFQCLSSVDMWSPSHHIIICFRMPPKLYISREIHRHDRYLFIRRDMSNIEILFHVPKEILQILGTLGTTKGFGFKHSYLCRDWFWSRWNALKHYQLQQCDLILKKSNSSLKFLYCRFDHGYEGIYPFLHIFILTLYEFTSYFKFLNDFHHSCR